MKTATCASHSAGQRQPVETQRRCAEIIAGCAMRRACCMRRHKQPVMARAATQATPAASRRWSPPPAQKPPPCSLRLEPTRSAIRSRWRCAVAEAWLDRACAGDHRAGAPATASGSVQLYGLAVRYPLSAEEGASNSAIIVSGSGGTFKLLQKRSRRASRSWRRAHGRRQRRGGDLEASPLPVATARCTPPARWARGRSRNPLQVGRSENMVYR